nr:degenerin-like protein unc-105 [Crassostrea gigas]
MAMYNDKTSTTSLKEMLKSMAENSSIHGVSRWVTSKYWYQRVLWILVFLGATGGMSYQLSLLFKSFRSYPVKASVDLRFSSLPFPAVSLCNMNPIKLSKLSLTNKDTQNVINGTNPSLWSRKKRSLHAKSNKWRRPISNQHNTGIYGLGASRRERKQKVFSPSLSSKSRRRKRLKRSLSGASDGLLGDNTNTVSSYHTSTSGYSGSGSGDYGSGSGDSGSGSGDYASGSGDYGSGSGDHYHGSGSGDYASDGTWSYFQDYKEELTHYVQDEWNQRVSQFQEEFQKNPSDTREKVGHSISDMIVSCAFNGNECYENNFTLFQSLEYGNCYTFQDSSYITKRSGPLLGLRLNLNIETNEYVADYMDAFGLRLVIHEPGTFPFPEEEGFTLNPRYETTIGMRLVSYRRASEPHGQCESGKDFIKMFGIRYTIPACLKLCRQREIIKQCGCIPSNSNVNGFLPLLPLCSNSTDHESCQEYLNFKLENNLISCDCRSPCKQLVYDTSLSGRSWPSKKFLTENIMKKICSETGVKWYFEADCVKVNSNILLDAAAIERISGNFLKVVIYYEDLNYEEIKEEPMYDGFQFISDIGGALGLFMGASILSFVEVFQFLIEILNLLRNKFFAKRDPALTPVTELSFRDPLAGKGEKEKSIGHF